MPNVIALIIFVITVPIYLPIYILVSWSSSGNFIYHQMRMGKNKKPFKIYKFRTMIVDAENLQMKYAKLNEADGPTFKIRNDPRFTPVGKFLAHTALDELPQLINIIKGEMAFVGPRPLPLSEAQKVSEKYKKRFSVLPGLTSPWVIRGAHKLSFDEWMKLDIEYVNHKNFWYDVKIILLTGILVIKSWFFIHV